MSKPPWSWQEKLVDSKDLPKVEKVTPKMAGRWGAEVGDTVVIPAPLEVDELMRKVPEGKVTTINEIRRTLAKKHGATIGCPITTGIFARIAAEAAQEAKAEGKQNTTPYWRTLKADGAINEKYPGGLEGQKNRLEKEGHSILKKGKKKYLVADFEKRLANL
jgi:alkylated DNA nucleotide flippase Atl1